MEEGEGNNLRLNTGQSEELHEALSSPVTNLILYFGAVYILLSHEHGNF